MATWLALHDDGTGETAPAATEREFRRYLECGILAHSCKCRGVCPSCTTRRMVETAAHLADHVIPHLPVRQWVLSVPKRMRYHLERDPAVQNAALHILLSAIERVMRLQSRRQCRVPPWRRGLHPPLRHLAQHPSPLSLHRRRWYFPGCNGNRRSPGRRAPRAAVGGQAARPPVPEDARIMAAWEHGGGFSVDAGVRIEADNRAGLERLLRYCARPAYALERLRAIDRSSGV
jgi:hypothetical protein